MLSVQDSFYGVCGLLAALSLTHPAFYMRYSVHLIVAVELNIVLIPGVALLILGASSDRALFQDEVYGFVNFFAGFLLEIKKLEMLSYTVMLFIVWLNLYFLSFMLDKFSNSRSSPM